MTLARDAKVGGTVALANGTSYRILAVQLVEESVVITYEGKMYPTPIVKVVYSADTELKDYRPPVLMEEER